jgi:hypothetical protein
LVSVKKVDMQLAFGRHVYCINDRLADKLPQGRTGVGLKTPLDWLRGVYCGRGKRCRSSGGNRASLFKKISSIICSHYLFPLCYFGCNPNYSDSSAPITAGALLLSSSF